MSNSVTSWTLVDAWIQTQCFVIGLWSAILSTRPAQGFLRHLVLPLVEPILLVIYGTLRYVVVPWTDGVLPQWLVRLLCQCYLSGVCFLLLRVPLVSVALQHFLTTLLLAVAQSTTDYDDLHHWLLLTPQQAIQLGSGSFFNPDNCFFSSALAQGPSSPNWVDADPPLRHLQITQSLLTMCILAQHPHLLRPAIHAGMFPGTNYYTTTNRYVHVLRHANWTVVILTIPASDVLPRLWDRSVHAVVGGRVRRADYMAMVKALRTPPHADAGTTPPWLADLARHPPRTLYVTGHGVSGGCAGILALQLARVWNVRVTGVVTFGATPVMADEATVRLARRSVHVWWRVEHGVELGPWLSCLPLPSVRQKTGEGRFQHVGQLVHVPSEAIGEREGRRFSRSDRMVRYSLEELDAIAETERLPRLWLDHNPMATLRQLQRAAQVLRKHGTLPPGFWVEPGQVDGEDDSEVFYSAHSAFPVT